MRNVSIRIWDNESKTMHTNPTMNGTKTINEFLEKESANILLPYSLQTNEGDELYEEHIIMLDTTTMDEEALFWNSNLGKEMKKMQATHALLHFYRDEWLTMRSRLFLKRGDQFITNADEARTRVSEEELQEDIADSDDDWYERPFHVDVEGRLFPQYLISKGAVLIGNALENTELLPEIEDAL